MAPEFLDNLNRYIANVKDELPELPPQAAAHILQLLAVIDYMRIELERLMETTA
jgi:hypothetical protein